MTPSRAQAAMRGVTAAMSGIGLDELNATAALTRRMDVKFLVPTSQAVAAVISLVEQGGRVLDNDGRRAFRYRSVYYDTPDLWTFRSHRQGRRRRTKIRTRTYVDSGVSFLEVKLNGARSGTDKHRIPHPAAMTPAGRDFVDRVLAQALGWPAPEGLSPSLLVSYSRFTLLTADGSSRITCDVDLSWRLPDGSGFAARDDLVLIELKTPPGRPLRLPSLRRPRKGLSKYCVGIAALRPELAGNPWYQTAGALGAPSRSRGALTKPGARPKTDLTPAGPWLP